MKKLAALLLVGVMALTTLASCGNAPAKIDIKSAADLEGKKIGVQDGTTGEAYAKENVKNAEVRSYKSGLDASLDLKNGSVDAVVLDELPAKSIVAGNPDLMVLDEPLTVEEYAIAVRKGDSELLNSINATIERMKTDGTYDALATAFDFANDSKNIVLPNTPRAEGSEKIRMGTNAAFKPFEYIEGTSVVGFDAELANEIAKDMGKSLQIEDMAFDSLLTALASNVIDFAAAGMSITEEKLKSVDFSTPYYSAAQVIIIRK